MLHQQRYALLVSVCIYCNVYSNYVAYTYQTITLSHLKLYSDLYYVCEVNNIISYHYVETEENAAVDKRIC